MTLEEVSSGKARGGLRRRWFSDASWDLIVWVKDDAQVWGFQLCYHWNREERALTWTSDGGYSHDRIDDGEGNPTKNQTPILVPAAAFPAREILERFSRDASSLDPAIRDFVIERVRAMTPRDCGASGANEEVANLGVVRPPLVYLASIATGTALDLAAPLPFLPAALAVPFGGLLVAVAVALFVVSLGKFRAAGTSVRGNEPTTAIVRTGPYRFSRNPIYLAFSLLQLGIAIWANSLWLIVTLLAAVAVMAYVVIPREEQYLERRFGGQYSDYKRAVRRWL